MRATQRKARPDAPRAGHKELHGRLLRRVGGARCAQLTLLRLGAGQAAHRQELLAAHPQPGARGDQELGARRRLEQVDEQVYSLQQVLHAVHDQQRLLVPQKGVQLLARRALVVKGEQLFARRTLVVKGEPQGLGDRGDDLFERVERGQRNPAHAVWEALALRRGSHLR
jgi:hypothetical protein